MKTTWKYIDLSLTKYELESFDRKMLAVFVGLRLFIHVRSPISIETSSNKIKIYLEPHRPFNEIICLHEWHYTDMHW